MKLRIRAGYSNYKELLQRMLSKLEEKIDKIYPKGSFRLDLVEEDKTRKITVRLGDFESESFLKPSENGNWVIQVDTFQTSKEEVFGIVAHEVTHISQIFNDFAFYEDKSSRHYEKETENEAVMVQIATLLKRGYLDAAKKEILSRADYFSRWTSRKFLQKLSAVGVPGREIQKFLELMTHHFNGEIQFFQKSLNQESLPSIIARFIQNDNLYKLFNYQGYHELKIELLKMLDSNPKTDMNWNWAGFEFRLKKM